jgi:hypothetical protein
MTTPTDLAIADAVAAMVVEHDVADSLSRVVRACAVAYPSDAVAVLVRDGAGGLELLSSSNHEIDEIELLQIQSDSGPCAESVRAASPVIVTGATALVDRWPDVGQAVVAAGFDAAHAYPMRWRGQTIGGLNLFLRTDATVDQTLGPLFADLATLAVLPSDDASSDHLMSRVHGAVTSRALIEQAKGVLAHRDGLDMPQAYLRLLWEARERKVGLSTAARQLIQEAVTAR